MSRSTVPRPRLGLGLRFGLKKTSKSPDSNGLFKPLRSLVLLNAK